MATTDERRELREALLALGLKRVHATADYLGTGDYAEFWGGAGVTSLTITWAPKTEQPEFKRPAEGVQDA